VTLRGAAPASRNLHRREYAGVLKFLFADNSLRGEGQQEDHMRPASVDFNGGTRAILLATTAGCAGSRIELLLLRPLESLQAVSSDGGVRPTGLSA
jgi:hypothetical protein